MLGVIATIIEKSMPSRAQHDYWRRAMTPAGVAALMLAGLAVMAAIGWVAMLDPNDPAWLALPPIPMTLTAFNIGLDDVIKRGRRELRRGLSLTAARIRELAQIAHLEIQKAYHNCINAESDRAAALPSPDRDEHLPPPRPRLIALTLSPRLLPIPRARACHDKMIGRV